jgi:hypothetical protein
MFHEKGYGLVQLPPDLPPIGTRPVFEQIQPEPPYPSPGRPVDRRPGTEPVLLPKPLASLGVLCGFLVRVGHAIGNEPHYVGIREDPRPLRPKLVRPRDEEESGVIRSSCRRAMSYNLAGRWARPAVEEP